MHSAYLLSYYVCKYVNEIYWEYALFVLKIIHTLLALNFSFQALQIANRIANNLKYHYQQLLGFREMVWDDFPLDNI